MRILRKTSQSAETVYLNQKLGIVEFRKKDWGLSSEDTDHLLSLRNLEILSMGLVKEQDLERLAALLKINTLIFELVPGERLAGPGGLCEFTYAEN